MRTHRVIIQDVGAGKVHAALLACGIELSPVTPQRWRDRDSIPGEYWRAFADAGFATLDELASAADARDAAPTVSA